MRLKLLLFLLILFKNALNLSKLLFDFFKIEKGFDLVCREDALSLSVRTIRLFGFLLINVYLIVLLERSDYMLVLLDLGLELLAPIDEAFSLVL